MYYQIPFDLPFESPTLIPKALYHMSLYAICSSDNPACLFPNMPPSSGGPYVCQDGSLEKAFAEVKSEPQEAKSEQQAPLRITGGSGAPSAGGSGGGGFWRRRWW